jgi:hypothetical protein
MPLARFEPTIPVFKRAKTFRALDRAATVTGGVEQLLEYKLLWAKRFWTLEETN